jgi:protein-S-isoprenylcysteine O-methyltransferase Ste14
VVAPVLRLAATTIVYALVLFGCAGTAAWPAAWSYLAVMTIIMSAYAVTLGRVPDLVAERTRPPAGAKPWDKPLVAVIGVIGPFALIVVAGLDHRLGWSGTMSAWWPAAGLALVAVGGTVTHRAVAANRFFSSVIRIQRDRDHRVVDTGPYRFVRHPGYLGSLVHMPGAALMLESWWALLVVAAVAIVVVARTSLEDRTLRAELDGYVEYARRVRFRLVPGIW